MTDAQNVLERFVEIELTALVYAEWNYKEDDDELAAKLEANIKENGQVENLIVRPRGDGTFEVVNGNHRLTAFRSLGFQTAICYDLGDVSEAEAKRIAVETNETRFVADKLKLAQHLSDLADNVGAQKLALTMPFSEAEIDNLRRVLTFDWSDRSKRVKCPECGKHFKAQ